MGIIVAAPGTGKSYAENFLTEKGIKAIDYDSNIISPKYDGWEKQYLDNILKLISSEAYDYIFVSFNEIILELLEQEHITYDIVVPENSDIVKQIMFGRYLLRDGGFEHIKWLKHQYSTYPRYLEKNIRKLSNAPIHYITVGSPYILNLKELFPENDI